MRDVVKELENIAGHRTQNGWGLTEVLGRAQGKGRSLKIGILFLLAIVIIVLLSSRLSLKRELDAGLRSPVFTPIPFEELKNWLDEGRPFRLVDARSPQEFFAGHIPTAVTIHNKSQNKPYQKNAQEIPVVVYCGGPTVNTSSPCYQAIVREIQGGARHVYWFKEGMELWRAQGYPMTQADG